jgi:hypothetical protein
MAAVTVSVFSKDDVKLLKSVDAGTLDHDDLDSELQDRLFEYFLPEMPYGTAKARTGDPTQFILDHLHTLLFAIEFNGGAK